MNPYKSPMNLIQLPLRIVHRRKQRIHERFFVIHGAYYCLFRKKTLNLQAKMSNMKNYHGFIKNWFIITIATCIFSYLLWALMDFDTFVGTGVTFEDLCFDIVYCSFYTLFSLWVSISLVNIFCKKQDKLSSFCRPYPIVAASQFWLGCCI